MFTEGASGLHEKADVLAQKSRRSGSDIRDGLPMRCEWACGGWCVGYGVPTVRQRVQLVYEWMYLFLVVDGRRGKLLWTWTDSMKSERIAAVNGLKHQTDVGALVWDGARGHRSELVESVGVPTIVQPPYSPELNPAERVFEEVQAVPASKRWRRWPFLEKWMIPVGYAHLPVQLLPAHVAPSK